MSLTPLDIRIKEFETVPNGLDTDEVQAFLAAVADEFEALRERLMALGEANLVIKEKSLELRKEIQNVTYQRDGGLKRIKELLESAAENLAKDNNTNTSATGKGSDGKSSAKKKTAPKKPTEHTLDIEPIQPVFAKPATRPTPATPTVTPAKPTGTPVSSPSAPKIKKPASPQPPPPRAGKEGEGTPKMKKAKAKDFWIKDLDKTILNVSHGTLKKLIEDKTVAFVAIGGRIGGESARKFKDHCQALLPKGKVNLVIDMGAIEFIASSGAGTLVILYEGFEKKGGTVQVLRASEPVTRVMDMLNLGKFLTLVESEEEALSNLPAYSKA